MRYFPRIDRFKLSKEQLEQIENSGTQVRYLQADLSLSADFGIERTYVRQPSLVDEFYVQTNKCPETGEVTHCISHPLYMLFNQERLDRLGPEAVNMWLKSLDAAGNSSRDQLKSKISDDDLMAMVKSRHIQHPCELERYINQLNERVDFCNQEVARVLAEEKAESEKDLQVDPSVDPQTK